MNKETIKTLLTKANFNTQVAEILYPSMQKRYIDRNEKIVIDYFNCWILFRSHR